jgi:hypothetical protein
MVERCLCGKVAKSDRMELSLRQEVEGGKQWIAKETRDSTCRYRASRGSFI